MNIYTIDTNNVNEAVKEADKIRLQNKNNWYQIYFSFFKVGIKCFDTWVQVSTKPYFNNCMGHNTKQFKDNLTNGLKRYIDNL